MGSTGCSTCGKSSKTSASAKTQSQSTSIIQSVEDCQYTIEQISIWLDKINCVRSKGLYIDIPNITKKQINAYVGRLLSAKNYASNPCHFEKELEEIESFITVLIAMNLCNN